MSVSIVVVESNSLGAELLSSALKRCQNQFDVVGQATTFAQAVMQIEGSRPRIALASVNLQDGEASGCKLISHIREHCPRTFAVALLIDTQRSQVLEAFRSGARGVISRDQPFRVLAKCIRKVHEGEIWASPDQIGFVFESLKKNPDKFSRKLNGGLAELTPREKDVVSLVIEGFRNAEIGARLAVSEHTVRNYIMKIYDKLGVSNRVQLTRHCVGESEHVPRDLMEA
jgi:DNA-binding NarL/FixJ family response regulator